MEAERFLDLVGWHHGQAYKLLRLRDFLREEAAGLTAQDPGRSSRLQHQASCLTRDILRSQRELGKLVSRACRLIERLPDREERATLRLCYLSRVSAQTAAAVLGCTAKEACRIRQRALMHLEGLGQ